MELYTSSLWAFPFTREANQGLDQIKTKQAEACSTKDCDGSYESISWGKMSQQLYSAATVLSLPRLRITWCAIASRSPVLYLLRFVCQRGYPPVALIEFPGVGAYPIFDQGRAQRIAAGMFSEHQLPLGDADRFRGDDFVRQGILEDAVLGGCPPRARTRSRLRWPYWAPQRHQ